MEEKEKSGHNCTVHPATKKHEHSKMNYYTFGAELTPLGVNSLSFA
jgi:hypothetical protein